METHVRAENLFSFEGFINQIGLLILYQKQAIFLPAANRYYWRKFDPLSRILFFTTFVSPRPVSSFQFDYWVEVS